MEQKEVFQAVLVADNFNDNFLPYETNALLPLVNVPLLDYALESLNRSGVQEVILFASTSIEQVKNFVKDGMAQHKTWSINMTVQIVSSEGCRCFGDALRDLDAKGLIRGYFVLMGADTVTNAHLEPILEQHKNLSKIDKGAAMTVIYKQIPGNQRTGDEILIASDARTNRLLYHQKLKPYQKERHFQLPVEIFAENSDVTVRHDLVDPQIAICSPSVLPLFADNFDFETRDDFIRGLLINEEILASTIYFHELPQGQYARKVSNWQSYNLVAQDVINRWVYPMVPNNGVCQLRQEYVFLRNMVYKAKDLQLERDAILKTNVVIGSGTTVGLQTILSHSVVGKACRIGKRSTLNHVYVFDGVCIGDSSVLSYCVIGKGTQIGQDCKIEHGSIIGDDCVIPENSKIIKGIVRSTKPDDFDAENYKKLGNKAYLMVNETDLGVDSDDEEEEPKKHFSVWMSQVASKYAESVYSSSSEDEENEAPSPLPEDSNIFLSEVIESLKRGYEEKSNPDFLILEINSSRYAYNMALSEVNFYVIKAILSLPALQHENSNTFGVLKQLLQYFGPVVKNYIKGNDAMRDCLKAFEETFIQVSGMMQRSGQILHYLYDIEVLSDTAILSWYEGLDDDSVCKTEKSLAKLKEWLEQSSEEESDEDDE